MIDVVISDDVDVSNGSATPYPDESHRHLRESAGLRVGAALHERLGTARHHARADAHLPSRSHARHLVARPARLRPRRGCSFRISTIPSWLTEGLAVYEESKLAGAGRIEGSEHRMIARAAAIDHDFPVDRRAQSRAGTLSVRRSGVRVTARCSSTTSRARRASRTCATFVDKSAANIIPYLVDIPAKQSFGITFSRAWRNFQRFRRSLDSRRAGAPLAGWRQLTRDGVFVFAPRWLSDSAIVYSGTPGRESFGAYRVDLNGKRTRIGRRNSRSANVPLGDDESLLYAQLDFVESVSGALRPLDSARRARTPDSRSASDSSAPTRAPTVRSSPRRSFPARRVSCACRATASASRRSPAAATTSSGPSRAGRTPAIASSRRAGCAATSRKSSSSTRSAASSTPCRAARRSKRRRAGRADDRGVLLQLRPDRQRAGLRRAFTTATFGGARTYRVSDATTGLFEPKRVAATTIASPRCSSAATATTSASARAATHRPAQWTVGAGAVRSTRRRRTSRRVIVDSSRATRYSPWRTLIPRYWLPTLDQGIDGGYRIGATTSGFDVIGRHTFTAIARRSDEQPRRHRRQHHLSVRRASVCPSSSSTPSQDWESLGGIFARDADAHAASASCFVARWSADVLATWIRQRYRTSISLTGGVGIEHRTTSRRRRRADRVDRHDRPLGTLDVPEPHRRARVSQTINARRSASRRKTACQLNVTVRDRLRSGVNGDGGAELQHRGLGGDLQIARSPRLRASRARAARRGRLRRRQRDRLLPRRRRERQHVRDHSGLRASAKVDRRFPVRGFAAGTLARDARARPDRPSIACRCSSSAARPGILPFFFDRSSLTLFGDYGTAWCPNDRRRVARCATPRSARTTHRHRLGRRRAESESRCAVVGLAVSLPARRRRIRRRIGGYLRQTDGAGLCGRRAFRSRRRVSEQRAA